MNITKDRIVRGTLLLSFLLICFLVAGSQTAVAPEPAGDPHIVLGTVFNSTTGNIDANDGTVTVYLEGQPLDNLTDIIGVNGDSNQPNMYKVNLGNSPFPVWIIGNTVHIIAQKTVGGATYTNHTTLVLTGDLTQVCNLTLLPPTHPFDMEGVGTYPSIRGIHYGNFTPNHSILVQRMYTYSCFKTDGHSEYAAFYYENGTEIRNGTWIDTYLGDYHTIEFDNPFSLLANITYHYKIITGCYPQIYHAPAYLNATGTITCTNFTDANGKVYYDWIPVIMIE